MDYIYNNPENTILYLLEKSNCTIDELLHIMAWQLKVLAKNNRAKNTSYMLIAAHIISGAASSLKQIRPQFIADGD